MEVLLDGAFVSSIVAGGTILAGFLTRPYPTFKVLTYCFICSLIVVIVDFYNLSGYLVEPRKMCLTPSQ